MKELSLYLPREEWSVVFTMLSAYGDIRGPSGELYQSEELKRLIKIIEAHLQGDDPNGPLVMPINKWRTCINCVAMIVQREFEKEPHERFRHPPSLIANLLA